MLEGGGIFWVGIMGAVSTFGLFIRMLNGLKERLTFEREDPVKTVRAVWWEHFRIILYVNGAAVILSAVVYLYF